MAFVAPPYRITGTTGASTKIVVPAAKHDGEEPFFGIGTKLSELQTYLARNDIYFHHPHLLMQHVVWSCLYCYSIELRDVLDAELLEKEAKLISDLINSMIPVFN